MLLCCFHSHKFMHESFNKDNHSKFFSEWFASVNTLFGELIMKLENENKLGVVECLKRLDDD